ncbi:hypothetical protein LZ32DRAFT_194521 [Colletotrichum eremochloae]|nr:hypothetical protein LZ32DRAFT_194521 [Colletotrichum eremochloae]
MEIILYLLHFKTKDEYKNIEPRLLALVARERNKYGCTPRLCGLGYLDGCMTLLSLRLLNNMAVFLSRPIYLALRTTGKLSRQERSNNWRLALGHRGQVKRFCLSCPSISKVIRKRIVAGHN